MQDKKKVAFLFLTLLFLTSCKLNTQPINQNTHPTIEPYQLEDIESAYIHGTVGEEMNIELMSEDISTIKTEFNNAFNTLQVLKNWPDAYSPGFVQSIYVSDSQRVDIYTFGETEQFFVSYLEIVADKYNINDFTIQSATLREIIYSLIQKYRN